LYVHTGSLKAHHCEGFIKLHKIDPLCPKGLTSEIGFRVYIFKNPPYSMSYLTIIYSRKHFSLHSNLHDLHFLLFSIHHDTAFTTRYINRLFSSSLRFFYHIIRTWAKMPSHFHHLYSFLLWLKDDNHPTHKIDNYSIYVQIPP
jgi:hypothetical protein